MCIMTRLITFQIKDVFVIEILVWGMGAVLILATVLVHFEIMMFISDRLVPWAHGFLRGRHIFIAIVGALLLGHIVEIWLWAIAFMLGFHFPELGTVRGQMDGGFNGYLHLSAVNFTSVGDSSISVDGALRYLIGCETLAGLMMITWSASFTYLKMEDVWKKKKG